MSGTMDGKVTVSVRSILVAALVLLALVVAYLIGANGNPVPAPASAAPDQETAAPDRRTVQMTGSGEATAVPDQMSFALSVTAKRLDLQDALDSTSGTMRRVLTELEDYGVRRTDVQTTGLSMYPEYDYPDYGPPILTGYRVSQRAAVTVRELSQGGGAIAAAVDAGGNAVRVRDIRLKIGDPDSVIAEARDAAVKEATTKAEQAADATGQTLGEVVSIREVGSGARTGYRSQLSGHLEYAARDFKTLPIRAGKDELKVNIEVVWAFE